MKRTSASDPEAVEKAKEREKLRADQIKADARTVMETPAGRRFVWWVMQDCGVFTSSVDPSGSAVYFKEGRRSVGLDLTKRLAAMHPELYREMWRELVVAQMTEDF